MAVTLRTTTTATHPLVTDTRVHRDVYTDPAVFAQELERIWYRTWLLVGHESEIPKPGDFKTTLMGQRPVIVCRNEAGELRAYLNSCRHRGALVCRDRSGNKKLFQCLYHAWTYKLDGSLASVPGPERYGSSFDRSQYSLQRVPRIASFHGIIFASFSESVPPLDEHLAGAAHQLDLAFGGAETDVVGLHEYEYRGNWKLHQENTIDGYHPRFLHRLIANTWHDGEATDLGNGHGVLEWAKTVEGSRPEHEKDRAMTVFPNMALINIAGFLNLRMTIPYAHDRTLVYAMALGKRNESDELRLTRAKTLATFQGPAGVAGADDVELFNAAQEGYAGAVGEGAWLDISRGAAHTMADGDQRGDLEDETAVRGAFRAWRRFMAAD